MIIFYIIELFVLYIFSNIFIRIFISIINFILSGYIEERLLSKYVNFIVEKIFKDWED